MSRRCAICGKKSMVAVTRVKLRGQYNPTSKKRKYPNLQWVRLDDGMRIKACTKCIRTMTKVKKVRNKKPAIKKEITAPKTVEKKPTVKKKAASPKISKKKTVAKKQRAVA